MPTRLIGALCRAARLTDKGGNSPHARRRALVIVRIIVTLLAVIQAAEGGPWT
jgi:hypothetical protein